MKQCPSCGYKDELSQRALLRYCKRVFGEIPIFHMKQRGWILGEIDEIGREQIPMLKDAMCKFFSIPDEKKEWWLSLPPDEKSDYCMENIL